MSHDQIQFYAGRFWLISVLLSVLVFTLVGRTVYLHVANTTFLQKQGNVRMLREVSVPAHRGMVIDRNGEPLAISTPVESIWACPSLVPLGDKRIHVLAKLLGSNPQALYSKIQKYHEKEFVYLKRHLPPAIVAEIKALHIPGIYAETEYRRYYPAAEVTAHLLGFTNVDDVGQEGLELAYEHWLGGVPGVKRVLRDRLGRSIEDLGNLSLPRPGKDLVLSLDRRIQYLAYRELKAAVQKHRARSGSAVMLDVETGEVLAMVNQPSFNPNNRGIRLDTEWYRNRAMTDTFEPGSTTKPFTILTALESGLYHPNTPIDTFPGWMSAHGKVVRDIHNYGLLTVSSVIQKSSNVGAAKIAMTLPAQNLRQTLTQVGFGALSDTGFPGEQAGLVRKKWRPIEQITAAYGYGFSVTPLQLAEAYMTLALRGKTRPVSLLRLSTPPPAKRVLNETTVQHVVNMLESVVQSEGTGFRAQVAGYRVGGKTGTARKIGRQGYALQNYVSTFVGIAPLSAPKLVLVVVVDDPQGQEYYGGLVAAPVFSQIMGGALRLLNIVPDRTVEPALLQVALHEPFLPKHETH